jgi:hypothetical protein
MTTKRIAPSAAVGNSGVVDVLVLVVVFVVVLVVVDVDLLVVALVVARALTITEPNIQLW